MLHCHMNLRFVAKRALTPYTVGLTTAQGWSDVSPSTPSSSTT